MIGTGVDMDKLFQEQEFLAAETQWPTLRLIPQDDTLSDTKRHGTVNVSLYVIQQTPFNIDQDCSIHVGVPLHYSKSEILAYTEKEQVFSFARGGVLQYCVSENAIPVQHHHLHDIPQSECANVNTYSIPVCLRVVHYILNYVLRNPLAYTNRNSICVCLLCVRENGCVS